jgi:hypothetical protein
MRRFGKLPRRARKGWSDSKTRNQHRSLVFDRLCRRNFYRFAMLLIAVFTVSTLQASDFHLQREPHGVTLQSGNDLVTVEVVGAQPGPSSPGPRWADKSSNACDGYFTSTRRSRGSRPGKDHALLSGADIDVDVEAENRLRISFCDHADHCLHIAIYSAL